MAVQKVGSRDVKVARKGVELWGGFKKREKGLKEKLGREKDEERKTRKEINSTLNSVSFQRINNGKGEGGEETRPGGRGEKKEGDKMHHSSQPNLEIGGGCEAS